MGREIVKHRNRLNLILLKKFNVQETNILFALFSKLKEKGTENVTFNAKKLAELANFSQHPSRFKTELDKISTNLLGILAYTDDGDTIEKFSVFNRYQYKRSTNTVTISVNPHFKNLFNQLKDNFTRFYLSELTHLRSTYAKSMFRLMKQYHDTRHIEIKITDLYKALAIPNSYRTNDINRRIIKPIKKELEPLFGKISFKKIIKGGTLKRAKKVTGYRIRWEHDSQIIERPFIKQKENALKIGMEKKLNQLVMIKPVKY